MSLEQLRIRVIDIANDYIGEREKKNNAGFLDPEFENKMRAIGFKTGHAWCAYFVALVWTEAYKELNPQALELLKNTFSGSVMQTRNNFRKKENQELGFVFSSVAKAGDLAVWQSLRNKATGHIGIVTSDVHSRTEFFESIEGNTNDSGGREGIEVAQKRRRNAIGTRSSLVLLGFISLAFVGAPEPKTTTKKATK